MNFDLSDEQRMLREAAVDALSRLDTVESARAATGTDAPALDLWPTAREAGWTGLLVDESHGGAGLGAFDAMLVAEQCGKALTGAGLIGHLMACEALRDGDPALLAELAAGERRAALVAARPPSRGEGWTVDGPGGTRVAAPSVSAGRVSGSAAFVIDAGGADVLVVAATDGDGEAVAVAVDAQAEGVTIDPIVRFDASRPLGNVALHDARGTVLRPAGGPLARAWYLGQALLAADALGVTDAMLELAVDYAKERQAFGRPIGSYQAVKHQLVEILRHGDKLRNLCFYAGFAAQSEPDQLPLAASCARVAGEQSADRATRTCVHVHGGIGNTWEHDAPFYWRRSQLSRLLLGGIADAQDRVAGEILAAAHAQ